jgi:hypothetical protein
MTTRLDDDETAVQPPVIRFVPSLPQALDRTRRHEASINHAHGVILDALAQAERSACSDGRRTGVPAS